MNLVLTNVTYKYPEGIQNVLENLSVQFSKGFTGIIGSNGSGKSTLLKLAAAEMLPVTGSVSSKGNVYYCMQRVDNKPEDYEEFISSFEKHSFRFKKMLGVEDEWFSRWETLSFGERKRCQIAVALFQKPDILLIDEPTNHIDASTRQVLLNALKSFNGIGLIVSHDRQLMDELCSYILSLDYPGQKIMRGNYSQFEIERDREFKELSDIKDNMTKEIRKIEREVKNRKQKAESADRKKSKKNISSKDHDAKSKIDLARLTGKDATEGRVYSRLKNRMDDMLADQQSLDSTAQRRLGISIKSGSAAKSVILFEPQQSIYLGTDKFLHIPDLQINRADRIGVAGPNGCGKSTLVRHIVKKLSENSLPFVYIPQEISAEDSALLLKKAKALKSEEKGKIFTIISRLNSEPKRLLESQIPSPGEVRKLMLAMALLESVELIIMDEPTNHMDLPSIECVEAALQEYDGSLLLVSHDKIFLDNLININWHVEADSEGSYSLKII